MILRKNVLQEQFYKTMPRAESFTAKKARGKIFTEGYSEKTLSHSSRTEKKFLQVSLPKKMFYIIISRKTRFKWLREERVLHDDVRKNAFCMTISRRAHFDDDLAKNVSHDDL